MGESGVQPARSPGVLDRRYAEGRRTRRALRYRLWRRGVEAIRAIRQYATPTPAVLDVGTADARMLSAIQDAFPAARCVGLEYSAELLGCVDDPRLRLVRGDGVSLPFRRESFDVAVATAVIEHLPQPEDLVRETRRVLRRGGVFIITAPDPFWDHVATAIGHLEDDRHLSEVTLPGLRGQLERWGFRILEAQKFMCSPVGFPFEVQIERAMKAVGLSGLLLNQLLVGRRE